MPQVIHQMLADAEIPADFLDAREDELIAVAMLGKDVEDFLLSPPGQYVIGSAAQDQRDIEEALTHANPNSMFGRRKIARLQQQHQAITLAITWLTEAVKTGMSSQRDFDQPDE